MRLLDNEIRIMRSDQDRIRHESSTQVSRHPVSLPRAYRTALAGVPLPALWKVFTCP